MTCRKQTAQALPARRGTYAYVVQMLLTVGTNGASVRALHAIPSTMAPLVVVQEDEGTVQDAGLTGGQ